MFVYVLRLSHSMNMSIRSDPSTTACGLAPGCRTEIRGGRKTRKESQLPHGPDCRGWLAVHVSSPNEDCGIIC